MDFMHRNFVECVLLYFAFALVGSKCNQLLCLITMSRYFSTCCYCDSNSPHFLAVVTLSCWEENMSSASKIRSYCRLETTYTGMRY